MGETEAVTRITTNWIGHTALAPGTDWRLVILRCLGQSSTRPFRHLPSTHRCWVLSDNGVLPLIDPIDVPLDMTSLHPRLNGQMGADTAIVGVAMLALLPVDRVEDSAVQPLTEGCHRSFG